MIMNLLESHCTHGAPALDDADIAALAQVPDWQRHGNKLERRLAFRDFHETIEFVNAVAWIVHRENHHPELRLRYRHCSICFTTHSAGNTLSMNDFICAARRRITTNRPTHEQEQQEQAAADLTGTIIAAHGRHYLADVDGAFMQCVTRGKKTNVAVGDIVHLQRTSNDQAVIEKIAERTTLLYRSDQYKSKLLAANITRLFIVIATEPGFADDLVSRSLVACEAAGVEAHLILNKTDVKRRWRARANGRRCTAASAIRCTKSRRARRPEEAVATLMPLLAGQSSIFIGQSGMGKSSLINLLVPDADIAVREISEALDTGKHTTTFTRLYRLPFDGGGQIIDSPGFQEFGLYHLSEGHAGTRLRRVQALPGRLQVLQLPPPGRTAVRDAAGRRGRQDLAVAPRAVRAAAARVGPDAVLTTFRACR
jgi:ribosome biogenesis GTPase